MNVFEKLLASLFFVGIATIACSDGTEHFVYPDLPEEEEPDTVSVGTVLFEDSFNQTSSVPDAKKWVLCYKQLGVAWANYLSGSYNQAYVEDGKLILKGEVVNGVYKAGGIQTKGRFEFTHGKVEVSAKIKSAQGAWAAIWMMPVKQPYGWPADGEIDIMENVSKNIVVQQTVHTYYTNVLKQTIPVHSTTKSFQQNDFNTYAVEWSTEKIEFFINGISTLIYPNLHLSNESTQNQWPFYNPFYIILNLSLGGPGTWPGEIIDSELPAYMEIDWVKVSKVE